MAETQKNLDDMTPEERKAERKREDEEQNNLPYRWVQTLQDVDINIPVPKGTRSRDLDVVIKKTTLKVALKGQQPIISGELCKDIKVDDSTWSIDDSEVIVHLEKAKTGGPGWWENVVKDAPKINTKLIEPENSKLDDLDGETRGMVEKMMFDQRQKAIGKPDSEELRKQQMFEKFKEQHPEMDFSQVKLN